MNSNCKMLCSSCRIVINTGDNFVSCSLFYVLIPYMLNVFIVCSHQRNDYQELHIFVEHLFYQIFITTVTSVFRLLLILRLIPNMFIYKINYLLFPIFALTFLHLYLHYPIPLSLNPSLI